MGLSLILVERDRDLARSLARRLRVQFHSLYILQSDNELHGRVGKNRPDAVVLDLESASLNAVSGLHRDFPALPIICIHRIPDEVMWVRALEAGASELCFSCDAEGLSSAILRTMAIARGVAA